MSCGGVCNGASVCTCPTKRAAGIARRVSPALPFGAVLQAYTSGARRASGLYRSAGEVAPSVAPAAPAGRFVVVVKPPKPAGDVADDAGDVVKAEDVSSIAVDFAMASAATGRERSIARGVELLVGARAAGDIRSGTATGVPAGMDPARWWRMSAAEHDAYFNDHAAEVFDPSDPASMTRERWASMSEADRRIWIESNVRDTNQRTALIQSAITGVFTQIEGVVRTIRETRLAEIREAAETARARMRTELEAEQARLSAVTDRARIDADRARAEADRAQAQAAQATTEAQRLAAQTAADEARARALTAQQAADAATAERLRLEAQAAGMATVAGAGAWTKGEMLAAGAAGVGVLGLLFYLLSRMNQPAPGYAAGMR